MSDKHENDIRYLLDRMKSLEERFKHFEQCLSPSPDKPSKTGQEQLEEIRAKVEASGERGIPKEGEDRTDRSFVEQVLIWNKWWRTPGCADWMDRTLFIPGFSYTEIFYRAMRLIFFDEAGNPGLLYQRALHVPAINVLTENGNRMNGFTIQQFNALLYWGDFVAYKNDASVRDLYFEGPDLPQDDDQGIYAKAAQPGLRIWFNFYMHVRVAQEIAALGRGFPPNGTGVDQLVWFTAATVLHEIMHNHGFGHPENVNYTAGSDYASTLPFVAEQAVLRASPYWNIFQGFYTDGLWLGSAQNYKCGTHW